MATSYTEEEMAKAMQELHIAPEDGKVDGSEAAKIMTWRAKQEYGVDYEYTATAVRQHVKVGHLKEVDTSNPRRSRYPYVAIFQLPLAPRRGASRRRMPERNPGVRAASELPQDEREGR